MLPRRAFSRAVLKQTTNTSSMCTLKSHASTYHTPEKIYTCKLDLNIPTTSKVKITPQLVACTLSRCPSDIIALSFFLWCGRQPNYFHNVQGFDYIVPVVCRLAERLKSVRAIVGELENIGCHLKAQTLLALIRISWHGAMYRLALEAFDEMPTFGYIPNTFARNMVIDIFFRIGHVEKALLVFRETQFPNFLTFNIMIQNLCKINDWLRVRDTLRDMVKKGFFPNAGSFQMILNCFCKVGRMNESFKVLGLMFRLGYPISLTTWNILIDGFSRSGEVALAEGLLGKMMASGFNPNVVTYTSLIKGFFGLNMVDQTLGLLEVMDCQGCSFDVVFYNMLIDCLSKAGRHDDAFQIFLSLPSKNIKPDSYTFCSIVSCLCSSRKFTLLYDLVRQMNVLEDLVICNSLINALCKAGFPLEALTFYKEMISRGFIPDRFSYTVLLEAMCKSGKTDDAVTVYSSTIVHSPGLDAHVHTVLFDGLIKVGKTHLALQLFQKAVAENYSLDVVSYTVVINGLFLGDEIAEACHLFKEMKLAGLVPNVYTYNVMLCGLCKRGNIYAVHQLVGDMDVDGIALDSISLNAIIIFLCKSHRAKSAFHIFLEKRNSDFKISKYAFSLLYESLRHAGAIGDASQLLKEFLEFKVFICGDASERFGKFVAPFPDSSMDSKQQFVVNM
ncbi:putative pentatricopeptide repeat-containing protein At1g16830 isoform X2 [Aristolochia californica]